MAVTVEEVQVLVTAEVDKALKDLKKVEKTPKGIETQFKGLARAIAGPAVAGLIIKSFVDISRKSSQLASDAEEVRSKFKTVFGDSADEINEWARSYSEAVGRTETDTLKFLGVIGDTLKPLGFTKDAVNDVSQQVVELANDLSSFNNLPTEEVIAGIQSALVGNVETLRRYGVVANEAAIQQEAINSGISETGKNLTAQQKAQAILNITLAGTTDAQGDLIRTQESSANVGRALNSTLKESGELYGTILNEALTPLKKALTDEISEVNRSVKAWILRNKVLDGEATLVETLVSKQNEREDAEERLAQAISNVEAATSQETSQYADQFVQLQRVDGQKETAIETANALIAQIEAEIESIKRQESAIERQIATEEAQLDAAIALTQATDDKTESTDENTESTDENTAAGFRNVAYLEAQNAQLTFAKRKFTEIDEELQKYNQSLIDAQVNAQFLAETVIGSLGGAFESLGQSLVDGGLNFKDFGKLALDVLADVLRSVGAQLAAQAALLFFGLIPDPVRGAGALVASAAAFTASGIASGAAGALAEGGSFTTNGPMPLLVGDNPGGQEEVTVRPVSSNGANVNGGTPGRQRIVLDFGGNRSLTGWIQEDIDNNRLRGSKGGAL